MPKAQQPIVCTTCNARRGEPCSAPTSTGRKNVTWFHYSREEG